MGLTHSRWSSRRMAPVGRRRTIHEGLKGMTQIFSPRVLLAIAVVVILGLLASPNSGLWVACLLAPPAILWILGGSTAYPVLGWVAGMNWLAIAADVLQADWSGQAVRLG